MGKKKELGNRIRTMRKSRDMTQEDLAKAINQSASSITMYETGRREPDFETLEALADAFNVPLSSLIETDEDILRREFNKYHSSSNAPKTPEARTLANGLDKMPQSQREAIMNLLTGLYPGLFEEGSENDDA